MTVYHDPAYLQRKLDHYNKWLLDPSRPISSIYPGFPEDIQRQESIKALREHVETRKKIRAEKAAARPKRARKSAGGPTKQDRAVEIFRQLNGVKSDVIGKIQSELGMTLAGATTYFYNAKKIAS